MATKPLQPGRPQEAARLEIPPGLTSLLTPRQIGIFPAFRAAMLEDAGREPALRGANWLGRDVEDFAVMLTEMFAYVCDVLAFYDGFIAGESYLPTATRTEAVRKLTGLIGYLPRPAVAAMVDLALGLEGRLPITVPEGTAFRSGSFTGPEGEEKPQIFTALVPGSFHPLRTRFTLLPQPAAELPGTPGAVLSGKSLSFRRGSVTVKPEEAALVRTGSVRSAAVVSDLSNEEDAAGYPITRVTFRSSLKLRGGTALSDTALLRPTGSGFVNALLMTYASDLSPAGYYYRGVYLDGLYRAVKTGQSVLLRKGDQVRWYTVKSVETYQWVVQSAKSITSTFDGDTLTTQVPAVTTPVTKLTFDQQVNGTAQRAGEDSQFWSWSDAGDMTFYFDLRPGGQMVGEAAARIGAGDTLRVREKVEPVPAESEPHTFLLRDLDERAVSLDGSLSGDGVLTVTGDWEESFTPPVAVHGAILRTTRGEKVTGEVLGLGDGSQPNQSFKLKKKPLTYVSDPAGPTGVRSTLTLYVDGVKWREVPRFYGRGADERVYIIRQDDAGESLVTFGDGVRGMRLATGARVVADYHFGAGAAAPPPGSVTQMVTPVKGVTAALNPLAGFGGADAEDQANMVHYAPRSALMLGRAVSLPDYEAVAATTTGVRVAKAEWRWSGTQQRPVIKIWYIGAGELGALIVQRLQEVSAEGVAFEVSPATAIHATLHVTLEIDDDYQTETIAADVVRTLAEALSPERTGIGAPLVRSQVLGLAAGVEGVTAPTGLIVNGYPYLSPGYRPPMGSYIEFTEITASE